MRIYKAGWLFAAAAIVASSQVGFTGADEPALVSAQGREFKPFTSAHGGFKVLLPSDPKVSKQSQGAVDMHIIMSEINKKEAWSVIYADIPGLDALDKATLDKVLDGSADGFVQGTRGKKLGVSNFLFEGKYPGREVLVEMPGDQGKAKNRVFIVGGRLYQVILGGPGDLVDSADGKKFFDSFALAKVTPKGAGDAKAVGAGLNWTGSLSAETKTNDYFAKLEEGKTYIIDMVSKDFDSYLYLHDSGNKLVASDDDGGGFPNARIIYRAPASGTFRIVAASFGMSGRGNYEVTIREQK